MEYEGPDRVMTVDHAAALLCLKGRRGLDRMRQEGRGPRFVRLGSGPRPRIRYRMRDLHDFMAESDQRAVRVCTKGDM